MAVVTGNGKGLSSCSRDGGLWEIDVCDDYRVSPCPRTQAPSALPRHFIITEQTHGLRRFAYLSIALSLRAELNQVRELCQHLRDRNVSGLLIGNTLTCVISLTVSQQAYLRTC